MFALHVGKDGENGRRDQSPESPDEKAAGKAHPNGRRRRHEEQARDHRRGAEPQAEAAAGPANEAIAEKADKDHAGGDRARMQAGGSVAETQSRLDEWQDVPLDRQGESEEAEEQIGVPGHRAPPHGRAQGRLF